MGMDGLIVAVNTGTKPATGTIPHTAAPDRSPLRRTITLALQYGGTFTVCTVRSANGMHWRPAKEKHIWVERVFL